MSRRPRSQARNLVMPEGRSIPRSPAPKPTRPEVDADPGSGPPPGLAKAGGELAALVSTIRSCRECGRCDEPRAFGSGYPRADLFFLKEHPGAEDLRAGAAFVTEAEAMGRALDALAIPFDSVYGASAVRCGETAATLDEVKACAPHLLVEIEAVGPKVVVAFGERAADALRALDGRCGLEVPDEIPRGEPVAVRPGLVVLATEPLPEGVTDRDAKRRLWRDLQKLPALLQ